MRSVSGDNNMNLKFKVLLTCVVICPYNINQQDALFSINLFQ